LPVFVLLSLRPRQQDLLGLQKDISKKRKNLASLVTDVHLNTLTLVVKPLRFSNNTFLIVGAYSS